MKTMRIVALLSLTSFFSCASSPKRDDNSKFKTDPANKDPVFTIESTSKTGLADYKFEGATGKVQWISCVGAKNAGSVAVMHRMDAGFDPASFCSGWIAQSFLKAGYRVTGINRPSYGLSTGSDDLSGNQSIEAIKAGLSAAEAGKLDGIWGYDAGAIAAAFYVKSHDKDIKWLIMGGGIYDLEIVARETNSDSLKKAVGIVKSKEGDTAFERRSIAWDFAGLPKVVGIYHAKDDLFSPIGHGDSINSQLRASEYKVYRTEVDAGGHDLPWRAHMNVLGQTLDQVAKASQ